jgi:catechol 2,3-dioxygenase-like lactoylglutathione lyase family enzyme
MGSSPGAAIILYVDNPAASAAFYAALLGQAPAEQSPTELDFGRTFVALDPDGHRLRVFAPAAP